MQLGLTNVIKTNDNIYNKSKSSDKRSIKNIKKISRHKRSIKNIKKISKNKRSIKNNKNNIITNNNENNNKNNIFTNKFKISKKILISIIILLVFGLISSAIIIILTKIKNKNNNHIGNLPISPLDIPINKDIISLENPYRAIPEEPLIITLKNLTYEEAESLINSKIIIDNHLLLNKIINGMNGSLMFCEKGIELKNISKISYILPKFLINPTKGPLKIVKSDLELYKKTYEKLIEKTNNLTKVASNSLKNFYSSLNITKEEVIKILYQYEEMVKNLSLPFILQDQGLNITMTNEDNINKRKLTLINEISEYKNDTENLNLFYNKVFNYINDESKLIDDEINEIPKLVSDLQNKVIEGKEQYEEKLKLFKEPEDYQNYHQNLIQIKNSLIEIKNDLNEKQNQLEERINTFDNEYRNINHDFNALKDDSNTLISNLNNTSTNIKTEIGELRERYSRSEMESPEFYVSNLVADYIIKSLDRTVKIVNREEIISENGIEVLITIINIEVKTSLDLLFVMDITGSMKPFLEQAKKNIINIMNKIILECPGIDINCGFIGYRDVWEINQNNYVNIDFTKNHQNLQDSIQNVVASGGLDIPEDVAWAMEMALLKSWKNNARFIIFVADAPCHGIKYHNLRDFFPNGVPNRKDIELLIKELAENNVSLFCMEITQLTNEMYTTFNNIYNNYDECEFRIIPLNAQQNLSDIVVDSAAEIYINQRNIEIR